MAGPRIEPGTFDTDSDGLTNSATATCLHYVVPNNCFVDAGVHIAGGSISTNQMRILIMVRDIDQSDALSYNGSVGSLKRLEPVH